MSNAVGGIVWMVIYPTQPYQEDSVVSMKETNAKHLSGFNCFCSLKFSSYVTARGRHEKESECVGEPVFRGFHHALIFFQQI